MERTTNILKANTSRFLCIFFSQMDGFKPKDYGYICFVDNYPFDMKPCMRLTLDKSQSMIYQNLTKDEFIDETLECELDMKAGKFLVPEFAGHSFTINELPLSGYTPMTLMNHMNMEN